MSCWQCGATVPDEARFCPYCGVRQARTCAACGTAALPGARFCAACGEALPETAVVAPQPVAAPAPRPLEAERRSLTVLFCDLVDSTILSETLDPEDLSEVMTAYEAACRRAVNRFDGNLMRVVGDGILCCFGYPRAHEDDVERAISAALDLVEAVSKLPAANGSRLQVRVGIATGLVVVTELLDASTGRTSEVVGSTPILAVRLQSEVPPNGIIVADSTRRLVDNVFTFEDLGTLRLKGLGEPVRAWRVLGRGIFNSRFEAFLSEDQIGPLVGRLEEAEELLGRCEQAAAGEGQVVILSGEAGIGKSRMVHALRDRLSGRDYRFIYCYCSPYQKNTPFYPLISLLERAYQIAPDDPPEKRREAFRAMVRSVGQSEDASVLLAALMSVSETSTLRPSSPQRERELTFDALFKQLLGLAGERPAVLVFENAHWADPSTTELLGHLVERIQTLRVTLIATLRPEGTLFWHHFPHVLELTLNRLTRKQCAEMVEAVAGGCRLPPGVLHAIIEKTDGVPLYVEEMTKALLESGFLQRENDHYTIAGAIPPMAVPATLQDSLMARLDRLAPAREVAQVGAVIGREFSYELLAAVSLLSDLTLQNALAQLVESGVVFQQGAPPRAKYVFKHALLQDAASASLLRRKRQRLHEAIAAVLEERTGERTEATLELLAHHCTEAGLTEKAIGYWVAAGEGAARRSANTEAVAHFRRAQALLATLKDTPEARAQELALLSALGPALITSSGPGTPEAQEVYRRALELCAGLPESPLHFAAHWGWWRISMDLRAGRKRADELLALAERLHDPGLLLQAHHCEWATLFNLGDHVPCCEHIETGLALYDPGQHRSHASLYGGHDPKVCALGERALSLWLLGYPEQALASVREGLAWARTLAHAGSIAHSLDQQVMLLRYRRDAAVVHRESLQLIEFGLEQALLDHRLKGVVFSGWARACLGEPAEGLAEMEGALETQRRIGTTEDFPVYYDMLAEVLAMLGRADEALIAIDQAFEAASSSGLTYWNPELYRRRAELLWQQHRGASAEAEASLGAGLELARSQSARALELRLAMTALRMAGDDPARQKAARAGLQDLYERFSEGFDTADLGDARLLLARTAA